MSGIEHSTKYYSINKGICMFQKEGDGTKAGPFDDFGNITELKVTLTTEQKKHYESRTSASKQDDAVGIRVEANGSFTLDSIHKDNLRRWMLGDSNDSSVAASASPQSFNIAAIKKGKWYKIDSKYHISSFVVKDSTDTTTYVKGTHYEEKLEQGMFMIKENAPDISDDDEIHTTYENSGYTLTTIEGGKRTQIRGRIRFLSDPLRGEKRHLEGFVALTPSGDYDQIGEDYVALNFTLEFVAHEDYPDTLFEVDFPGEAA